MHAFRSSSAVVRFSWSDAHGPSLFEPVLARRRIARPVRLLCAESPAHRLVPVMVVDAAAREAWVMGSGTRAIAGSLMPPMRPASLGLALALAAGSLVHAPLAVAAVAYAGYRALQRSLLLRDIHCRLEAHLRCALPHALAGA